MKNNVLWLLCVYSGKYVRHFSKPTFLPDKMVLMCSYMKSADILWEALGKIIYSWHSSMKYYAVDAVYLP